MLEELISQGKYSPLEVKSTMKAWGGGGKHSRHSKDKIVKKMR